MLKMTRWFIWGLFTLLLLTALDQVLLRVALPVPGYADVQVFYVDFRSRLLGLAGNDSVAQMINDNKLPAVSLPAKAETTPKAQTRYLYADGEGALQFADSLDMVPLQYRRDAQPLAE